MKINQKEIKQKIEREEKSKKRQYDTNGRAVIDMRIEDDDDFLSPFSQNETPHIASDVAEFLESAIEAVPPSESLTLRLHSDCIDDKEKIVYEKAIKAYYTDKYFSNKRELMRNRILSLLFGIAGVLILTLSLFIGYKFDSAVWAEVVDIVAWVLLWETVDIAVFGNRTLRLEERKYLSFIDMKIEYLSLQKDK